MKLETNYSLDELWDKLRKGFHNYPTITICISYKEESGLISIRVPRFYESGIERTITHIHGYSANSGDDIFRISSNGDRILNFFCKDDGLAKKIKELIKD